ncbi:MAG: glycosyltransferase family 2 protein [Solirubrobacteraceae bacterium]
MTLVSIAIPTFNRAATLERALASALAQTHPETEILVSDNASTDATAELCAAHAGRVRYLRQPRNVGPTENFNTLFRECRGDYVLMLADDDWLDPDYVERCLTAMRTGDALVCGRARYESADFGSIVDLEQDDSAQRVLAYYRQVSDNAAFYGVMPRTVLSAAAPLRNVLGNDWLLLAAVAHQGRIRTIEETSIHRAMDGTSADVGRILETFGEPRAALKARIPQLVIAREVWRDIFWRHPIFRSHPLGDRLWLASRAALLSISWRSLAWHLTAPTFAGSPLFDRLTRALGAGRD